jgi:predicted ATP-grasp superfamily ATP-dependent carboligase
MQRALVLIGFAEALSAPEVTWSLVDAGFDVIAFSRRGRRAALRSSRHVEVHDIAAPEIDCEAALADLHAVLEKTRASRDAVLLPLDDASVWLCSRLLLPTGWILAGAAGDCAEFALDKRMQIARARDVGFNVPQTFVAQNVEDLRRCAIDFPLMLRPAVAAAAHRGKLGKGRNWICANASEIERVALAWRADGPLLVQPYLEGTGEGIFGLATQDGVVAWSAHRRLRMMNPHGSGSSACISQPVPDDVKARAAAMIRSSAWRGMFMVEMLRTADGKPWFVEFNGRAWGSMALSRRQSLEYPAWAVELALDCAYRPLLDKASRETVLCRNLAREVLHLLFILRGPKSSAVARWPAFWPTLRELFRDTGRSHLYNWRSEDWRVFFSDCWVTIRNQMSKVS